MCQIGLLREKITFWFTPLLMDLKTVLMER